MFYFKINSEYMLTLTHSPSNYRELLYGEYHTFSGCPPQNII